MTFRRTTSGLSNFHLFVNADAVVFLEGGQSFNRDDVDNGSYNSRSSDIRFWQVLFKIYRPGKVYQFRSVGSKAVVKSIAEDVQSGHVKHVVVAMDRDFDHINERTIISENVLYTSGYSWENDCWCDFTVFDAYCSLSGSGQNHSENEKLILEEAFKQFSNCLQKSVHLDAILSQHGDSLFDREKPNRYIKLDVNDKPTINIPQIKKSIIEARIRNHRPIMRKTVLQLHTLDDCFGHLIAEFGYRLLTYLLRSIPHAMPNIPKEYAVSMIVEKFERALSEGLLFNVKQHYDCEFLKVMT